MEKKIEYGGPAFPIPPVGTGDPRDGMSSGSDGMTLRDYFAAAALPALIASAIDLNHVKWDATAVHAYMIADAMLAGRTK
jgi:hypothetical protein